MREVTCFISKTKIPALVAVQLDKDTFIHREHYHSVAMELKKSTIVLDDVSHYFNILKKVNSLEVQSMRAISKKAETINEDTIDLIAMFVDLQDKNSKIMFSSLYNLLDIEQKIEVLEHTLEDFSKVNSVKHGTKMKKKKNETMLDIYRRFTKRC